MLVVRVRYLVCQLFHTLILECIVGYAGDNDGDGDRELKQHIYIHKPTVYILKIGVLPVRGGRMMKSQIRLRKHAKPAYMQSYDN